jgi:cell division protease FtsH
MGGRVAEEIVFQQRTTGAANDIEKATQLARRMVCEWGMSENLGPLSFGKREEQIFLGREIAQHRDYSEQTAVNIDQEVRRIVEDNYERCKGMLTHNVELLHGLAEALLEKETLESRDIEDMIAAIKPEILTTVPLAQSRPLSSSAAEAPGQVATPPGDGASDANRAAQMDSHGE